MGCIKTITHEKFPKQSDRMIGQRVQVCYHYNTKHYHYGEIVRNDTEEPFETIIKLDDGRYLRGEECQYSLIDLNNEDYKKYDPCFPCICTRVCCKHCMFDVGTKEDRIRLLKDIIQNNKSDTIINNYNSYHKK